MDFGASNDDGLAPGAQGEGRPPARPREGKPAAEAPQAARRETRERPPAAAALPPRASEPDGWPLYLLAFAIAVLWALGPIAFAVGYRSGTAPLQYDRFALTVFSLLAIGPGALVFGVAYFIRQGQKLAAEARRARELEAALMTPALRAAAEAGDITRAVREEIASATAAADLARESLEALRQALAAEADSLVQATHASLNAAQQLSGELGRERGELEALGRSLESQAVRAGAGVRVAGVDHERGARRRSGATPSARSPRAPRG